MLEVCDGAPKRRARAGTGVSPVQLWENHVMSLSTTKIAAGDLYMRSQQIFVYRRFEEDDSLARCCRKPWSSDIENSQCANASDEYRIVQSCH